ncbi:MAG: HlyD family efflux transporter periplasmic adaptor subunit [Planctomycetaceae bacterium]|nr:HlyD family efflux transporter periplasmic adaptor subunit [Planctomycetaceae bacterium]
MAGNVDLKSLARRGDEGEAGLPAPRRHIVSRYVIPGGLAACFVALLVWSTRDAFLPRRPVSVVSVHVTQTEFRTAGAPLFKAAGWVEPRPTPIRVASLIPGVVRDLLVVEDQAVKLGEPVARLVDDDARLAVADAEAQLEFQRAELLNAEAAAKAADINLEIPAHLELPVAEAEAALAAIETEISNLPLQLERAEANLEYAMTAYELKSRLVTTGSVPALEFELSKSAHLAAQAEVRELTLRAPVLEQQRQALIRRRDAAAKRLEIKTDEQQAVGQTRAQLAAARARVRVAEVTLDTARLQLSRTVIPAPCNGRVLNLVTSPGAQVGATSPTVAAGENRDMSTVVTLYQPESLQVRIDVRFEDLPQVLVGQPVLIESPALAQPLTGEVLFLTGYANIQKNTLEVKASLNAAPEFIKPEMLIDVTFLAPEREAGEPTTTQQHRMFLPKSLVEQVGETYFVWLADQSRGIARRVQIRLGQISTPTMVEVVEGLNISNRVISEGRDGLVDGERIEIRGESDVQPVEHHSMSMPDTAPAESSSEGAMNPRFR